MDTVSQVIEDYLAMMHVTRAKRTWLNHHNGLSKFSELLAERGVDPNKVEITDLPEVAVGWFAESLADKAPGTIKVYVQAVKGLYRYTVAEDMAHFNLVLIDQIIKTRTKRQGQRLPQFPTEDIDKLLDAVDSLKRKPTDDRREHLRNLRDRALIITLADTGLRIHETVTLKRGEIDWNEYRAVIIGKGDKQAVVRFSKRSIEAIKDYLASRQQVDGNSGKPLHTLPLFARHDIGAGKRVTPIGTNTGRDIIRRRVEEFLGKAAVGTITPHSFRHYFVTRVLHTSGNMKLAQRLARHSSINTTQKYAHLSDDELDAGYYEAIERPSPAADNIDD